MLQLTFGQALAWASVATAGSIMVRTAASKRMLSRRADPTCPACGRRRVRGRCGCTDVSRF